MIKQHCNKQMYAYILIKICSNIRISAYICIN